MIVLIDRSLMLKRLSYTTVFLSALAVSLAISANPGQDAL